ncbi:MAG: hypothetical protein ACTSRI_07920 [Promethearchaeota archaeon]
MLHLIQEYLNKNRCFTIDNIIPFINVGLKKYSNNINYAGIREILKSLIKKKQIVEGSKLIKDEILNNENRKKIFNYISKNPGVYFNRVAKKLDLSNYILAWHIKILLKFNFIRSEEIENHEVFFNLNLQSDPDKDYLLSLISKEKVRKIIKFLKYNQEGCSKTQMSKALHMHSTTIANYVEKLDKYGILLKKRLANKTLFFFNEKYYRKVLKN